MLFQTEISKGRFHVIPSDLLNKTRDKNILKGQESQQGKHLCIVTTVLLKCSHKNILKSTDSARSEGLSA